MIIVTIGADLRVTGLPTRIKGQIIDELTIKNPMYQKALRIGIPIWNISKFIRLYENRNQKLIIPRGYLPRLLMLIQGEKRETRDHRLLLPQVDFGSKINLRDYQRPIVPEAQARQYGVVVAPCGSGKTLTGLELVAQIKQPTLWLTHTRDLANQSMQRAKEFLDLRPHDIGFIAGKQHSIGEKLTIGMVPTLARRDLRDLKNKFGCIIIDECHHCFKDDKAVGQFYSVISAFPARYRFGLTASEHRSDGLIESMFATIGPKIYEVTQDELKAAGHIVIPDIHFINTEFTYESDDEMLRFSKLLKEMSKNPQRNALIYDAIVAYMLPGKHYGLVLGDSLEHLENLQKVINNDNWLECGYINGSTPKRQRENTLQTLRDGEINLLFATYNLAKEGLDIPNLDRLFLITPKKDRTVIQQAVGRVMRPSPGKEGAKVYDFYDGLVGICRTHARARVNHVYKELGCVIHGGPRTRKPRKNRDKELQETLTNIF